IDRAGSRVRGQRIGRDVPQRRGERAQLIHLAKVGEVSRPVVQLRMSAHPDVTRRRDCHPVCERQELLANLRVRVRLCVAPRRGSAWAHHGWLVTAFASPATKVLTDSPAGSKSMTPPSAPHFTRLMRMATMTSAPARKMSSTPVIFCWRTSYSRATRSLS